MTTEGPLPASEANSKTSNKTKKAKKEPSPKQHFGIGEWYGKSFVGLTPDERRNYALIQTIPKDERPPQLCPFQSTADKLVNCGKAGGVCSLRAYEKSPTTNAVSVSSQRGTIRVVCPNRFEEAGSIYRWIGEIILSTPDAIPIGETPFLEPVPTMGPIDSKQIRKVGRIDNVLVKAGTTPLQWCPVEKQAVYFSGRNMGVEFKQIAEFKEVGLPFPVINHRPDYRSSGPKRLLPQLETKVPTLSRWAKKMAVVVDEDFFNNLGQMKVAAHLSNAEVVWFVVKFVGVDTVFRMERLKVFMTTLKEANDGLVAAKAVSQEKFEETITNKLKKLKKVTASDS